MTHLIMWPDIQQLLFDKTLSEGLRETIEIVLSQEKKIKEQEALIEMVAGWKRGRSEGADCWKTSWATVWDNGVWHTWDKDGVGGENSSEATTKEAKYQAFRAAFRQGFIGGVK